MLGLRDSFQLDPTVTFLNHGSFGATPRSVFEAYQAWQLRLERQPVLFLARELDGLLKESRQALGEYLNSGADDLVYIPNATHGVNIVARSLSLQAGDEILATDHEYGACDYSWEFACEKSGSRYIRQPIPLPVRNEDEIVEQFWAGVSQRTKAIYLSHITSSTALRLPVEKICRLASKAGILTIVDAAHSPGQIKVDLGELGADIVFGNCHKWMLAPKGAGFFYARRQIQPLIEPLIVSWGFHAAPETATGFRFVDLFQWIGTKDPAAALTVPRAIEFMRAHNWDQLRKECHELLRHALERISELTLLPPPYPIESDFYAQMGIAPLPPSDLDALKSRLYDEYKIEVPLVQWRDKQFIRVSVQAYNRKEDIDLLLKALQVLLPQVAVD
jgi:isopenicillin-N epimerase